MDERTYLRQVQYRDDSNLNARFELHRRFSVNPGSFHRWVFDQLEAPADARLLDAGCGAGYLWATNADRVPVGWGVLLADFSPGMIAAARQALGGRCRYLVADVQALPHPCGAFDAALANHMLYHVPDRQLAVRELARVLRPDGVLYAVTNGLGHMRELDELMARFGTSSFTRHSTLFGLENGAEQLREVFAEVELRRWDDALAITEAEPIVAYVRSMPLGAQVDCGAIQREAAAVIEREGVFRVRKATGLFVARSPIQSRQ
jgi:SAM-dependent methyltransferase